MYARLSPDGSLLIDGQFFSERGEYEWAWTFHPETFPEIRRTVDDLAGDTDLLILLRDYFATNRYRDPGGWLHKEQGIPAEFWNWFDS